MGPAHTRGDAGYRAVLTSCPDPTEIACRSTRITQPGLLRGEYFAVSFCLPGSNPDTEESQFMSGLEHSHIRSKQWAHWTI